MKFSNLKFSNLNNLKFSNLKWMGLCLLALTACDKGTDIDNPEGPQGSGTMQALSPEESRAFIEETAGKFLMKFNPADQQEIIELAAYYDTTYGSYKLPENFYEIIGEIVPTPGEYLRHLLEATGGDLSSLTRSATDFSFGAIFKELCGIYQPDAATQSWVKTSSSDDIEFQFKNMAGEPAVMKVAQQGMGTDRVNVTVDLTDNGVQLANSVVSSSYDSKKHTISADVDARMMNLRAQTEIEGKDEIVESRSEFFISNEKMSTAYATLKGSGLCDAARWKELKDTESLLLDNLIGKMVKKGYGGVDVMGAIQVYGQMDYYEKLPLDIAGEFAGWGSTDKNMVKNACQEACDRLNKNIKSQVRYNGTKTDQATLLFQPGYKEWDTMWGYSATPMIQFPDHTLYTPAEYFAGFADMAPKLGALLEAYQKIWIEASMGAGE
ncbi:MAG: hypothetical protein K2H96_00380 [Muribaculaceae bacterium]|nr:hypothetical protein [Muribaculaceae bacterium]